MKRLLLTLLLACSAPAADYPDPNLVPRLPGTDVGVIYDTAIVGSVAGGGIPLPDTRGTPGGHTTRNVTQAPYNADNTGVADATSAIQSALNASGPGDVVYMPAGTYRIDGGINRNSTADNITLRGDGTGLYGQPLTKLMAYGSGVPITIGELGAAQDYAWANPAYASPSTNNTVTAGATAGSTSLTIADTSPFAVGDIIQIALSNQVDTAAIAAGAIPTMSVVGNPTLRRQMSRVTGIPNGTTLTIFPALHFTPDAGLIAKVNRQTGRLIGFGLEDFWLDADNNSSGGTLVMNQSYGCWVKNVKVTNVRNRALWFSVALNCEVRHCYFSDRQTAGGTNGAGILCDMIAQTLIEDNILLEIFPLIELNHSSTGNVIAYNFIRDDIGGQLNVNHAPHNSFNLIEGNITPNIQSDGYFGSQSNSTFFRNWVTGTITFGSSYTSIVAWNRFNRHDGWVGNILGSSGWPYGANPYSLGNPNIGNSDFNGNAQPSAGRNVTSITRASTTATVTTSAAHNLATGNQLWIRGAVETAYNGYYTVTETGASTFTYTVSGSPSTPATGTITMGREWRDWKMTGELTTRTSDTAGVVTVSNIGDIIAAGTAGNYVSIHWSAGSNAFYTDSIAGTALTFSSLQGGGVLPALSTIFTSIYTGNLGYQEIDRDVYATNDATYPGTTILKGNYHAWSDGGLAIPANQALGSDTLADSYFRNSAPDFLGSLTWPVFDPTSPGTLTAAGWARNPAGYRYVNNNEDYLGGVSAPVFSPVAGTYGSAQSVTMTSGTGGATMRYTTNGSTPTSSSGTIYSGAINISSTTTLKAIAYNGVLTDSAVTTGVYTITIGGTVTVSGTTTVTGTLSVP